MNVPLGVVGVPFRYRKRKQVSAALIPVVPSAREAPAHYDSGRPRADFLAQLIATSGQAPQTRVRRRAEPAEAIAAYGASDRSPLPARHALSRSL